MFSLINQVSFRQYEWTMKALKAGKHVILEKPAACTAQEVENMFSLAKKKNLILLEAFHSRYGRSTSIALNELTRS